MKKRRCILFAMILPVLAVLPLRVHAAQVQPVRTETAAGTQEVYDWTNADTGHHVKVQLPSASEAEQASLISVMQPVTQYCDAAVVMDSDSQLDTRDAAQAYAADLMGASGVLLYFDMNHRELYLCTKGSAKNTITDSLALSITDNAYEYAVNGDYAGCGVKVFEQIERIFSGQKIAQPMKVITTILFALMTGLLLNFVIVSASRKKKKKQAIPYFEAAPSALAVSDVKTELLSTRPKSDGGKGGGGSTAAYIGLFILEAIIEGAAGSGGGHSGGGSHGGGSFGGGGHRF